jgi:hypothetical protein
MALLAIGGLGLGGTGGKQDQAQGEQHATESHDNSRNK